MFFLQFIFFLFTLVIAQTRLQRLGQEYKRFSKAAGLRTQQERLEVAGFGPKQASTPAKAEKKNSSKPVLEQLNFADGASDSDIESVESEVAKIPQKAREIAERAISHVVITDDDRSGYSPRTGVIFLNRTRDTGTVAHEYAHAIETALDLYEDSEFLAILRKGFENLSLSDIIEDEDTFSKPIFRIWSKKLVSLYQGRLYERYGIYDGQHIMSSLCGCGLNSDAEIRKKMSLGNPVGSSNLQAADTARLNDLVACLCADRQNLTHLLNVQHIRIILQHELIGFTLGDV